MKLAEVTLVPVYSSLNWCGFLLEWVWFPLKVGVASSLSGCGFLSHNTPRESQSKP